MTQDELRKSGELYLANDEELLTEQKKWLEYQYDFNLTRPSESEKRQRLLKSMFATIGQNCYIEPPLHANWAGKFCHLGNNVYANFNLTMVDDGDIFIEDDVMIGPNVTIISGTHPTDPELRRQIYQYTKPVIIKNNAWIGANAIILPGVTIGKNAVIGAGSVVTKDIPDNVVACGNPCKVMHSID